MNFFEEKGENCLDKRENLSIIFKEIAYSLIKSGGGNGPMKPGNLLIQGAKSGGRRKMRIRYSAHRIFGVRFFFVSAPVWAFGCVEKGIKTNGKNLIYL
jgi:hypothetical protein